MKRKTHYTGPIALPIIASLILVGSLYLCYLGYESFSITLIKRSTTAPAAQTQAPDTNMPTFDDLLDAIEWVESRGDVNAVGDYVLLVESDGFAPEWGIYKAVGSFQLHEIYVDDICRILGKNKYTYADRWDRDKSRKMTEIYIMYYAGIRTNVSYTTEQWYETMARIHNGGPDGYKKESTKPYWDKVKARMAREKK